MSDSESPFEEIPVKRGRPQGKGDSTQRTRRTAQEISDDKVRVAQMKLDALKETEEKKLANKKVRAPRAPRATVAESALPKAPKKQEVIRDESPMTPPRARGNITQQRYDSWFPSSPRTRY